MNDPASPAPRSDEQLIQDYLAGRLSQTEAAQFESRCFEDDALGNELEQALEIRAAALQSPAKDRPDTTAAATEQALPAYLAGRLTESEADAFEERLFADESLAQETHTALEIRAALSRKEGSARTGRPQPYMPIALAFAAAIAALAVGLYWLQAPSESSPVFRGLEQRMGLEIELNHRDLRAKWNSVPGATGYELRVYARSGELLRSVEVADSPGALQLSVDADTGTAAAASVEVAALDDFGQELLRSERIALTESSDARP